VVWHRTVQYGIRFGVKAVSRDARPCCCSVPDPLCKKLEAMTVTSAALRDAMLSLATVPCYLHCVICICSSSAVLMCKSV